MQAALIRKVSAQSVNKFDDISMLDGRTLQHLNLTLQDIFDNHTNPFAVISVLTVGDLLQLNTVGDPAVFKTLQSGYEALAD